MTHSAILGQDPRGNFIRMDNLLANISQKISSTKAHLENMIDQQTAAREEVKKEFPLDAELKRKTARLVELDALLNMDGKQQPAQEADAIQKAQPSILDQLKKPPIPGSHKHTLQHRM